MGTNRMMRPLDAPAAGISDGSKRRRDKDGSSGSDCDSELMSCASCAICSGKQRAQSSSTPPLSSSLHPSTSHNTRSNLRPLAAARSFRKPPLATMSDSGKDNGNDIKLGEEDKPDVKGEETINLKVRDQVCGPEPKLSPGFLGFGGPGHRRVNPTRRVGDACERCPRRHASYSRSG